MAKFVEWVVLSSLLMFAGVTAGVGQQPSGTLRFINETDATIRVEVVTGEATALERATIQPLQQVDFILAPSRLVLDLVSFKSTPPRTHRVAVETLSDKRVMLRFTAQRLGLYLLEDRGNLAAIAVLPSSVQTSISGTKGEGALPRDPALACQPLLNDWAGVALWKFEEFGQHYARYYRKNGDFLCGVNGGDVFHVGPVYLHYTCTPDWTECARDEMADFRVLPMVYTSEVPDVPVEVARGDDPKAQFVRTQKIVAINDQSSRGSMTMYTTYSERAGASNCSEGYRLHYQGSCINIADELADDPDQDVRMVAPSR